MQLEARPNPKQQNVAKNRTQWAYSAEAAEVYFLSERDSGYKVNVEFSTDIKKDAPFRGVLLCDLCFEAAEQLEFL
ncbi:hypothetical protein J2Z66_000604 [Paenibacillus eucommiae]|uniref:Uncharacterized protein n=1 Tax=Paenibacillus eucommiae TaxID=1355755 RepID=A0ABS4IQX8_9BACL|nr:hypothetical protein [Paenibacillus eucommiae]